MSAVSVEHSSSSGAPTEHMDTEVTKTRSGVVARVRVLTARHKRVTKSGKLRKSVKRSEVQSMPDVSDSDNNNEEDDVEREIARKHCAVVKDAHWTVGDYTLTEEKKLLRLATRGVVQLFNAVSKHQKSIEEKLKEVGPSERKKHKVLSSVDKGGFIDMLKGEDHTAHKATTKGPTEDSEPSWSILRDDYLKNSKLQDWDKDDEKSFSEHSDTELISNSE